MTVSIEPDQHDAQSQAQGQKTEPAEPTDIGASDPPPQPESQADEDIRVWPAFDVERELTEAYRAEHQIPDGEPLSAEDRLTVKQAVRHDAYDFFVRAGRYDDQPEDRKPVPEPLYEQSGFWKSLLETDVAADHAELREKERAARDVGPDLNYGLAADLPDTELPEEPDIDEPDPARQAAISSFFDKAASDDIEEAGEYDMPPDLPADLPELEVDRAEQSPVAAAPTQPNIAPPPEPASPEPIAVTGNVAPAPVASVPVAPTPSPGPAPDLGPAAPVYSGHPQQGHYADRSFQEPRREPGHSPSEPQPALSAAAQEIGALVATAASGATSLTKGLLSGLMHGLRKPGPTPQEDRQLFLQAAQASVSSAEIATDKAIEACQAFEACEEVKTWRAKVDQVSQRSGIAASSVIADMPKKHPDLLQDWQNTLSLSDVADRYRDMTAAVQHHEDAWLSAANAAHEAEASPDRYFDHAETASRRLREESKAIPTADGKSTIAETIRKFMDNLQQHVRRLFGLGAAAGSRPAPVRP